MDGRQGESMAVHNFIEIRVGYRVMNKHPVRNAKPRMHFNPLPMQWLHDADVGKAVYLQSTVLLRNTVNR